MVSRLGRWVITGEVERYTLFCGEMGGGEVRGTYLLIPDSTFILDLDPVHLSVCIPIRAH